MKKQSFLHLSFLVRNIGFLAVIAVMYLLK